jgi:hypothetical protein
MNVVERSSRLAGFVLLAILAGALLVFVGPGELTAQAAVSAGKPASPPGWRIKHDVPPGPPWRLKHDSPPGQPCPQDQRPCPPGQRLKATLQPPGHASSVAGPDLAPSDLLVELVSAAATAELPVVTPVPPQAQQNLYWALVQGAPAELTGLAGALYAQGNEEARDEAVTLVTALQLLPYGDEYLPRATEAFNAFVDASSATFLRDPAPEFLVVHAFLGTLIDEAVSGGERRSDAF